MKKPIIALIAALALAVGTTSVLPAVAQAQSGPCGSSGVFASSGAVDSCTYSGTEGTFSVPVGLPSTAVTAIGGEGGNAGEAFGGDGFGGLGAVVANDALPVPSGATLYVEVGENGGWGSVPNVQCPQPTVPGGLNDGGSGGAGCGPNTPTGCACDPAQAGGGAGGGGSSDISLEPPTAANRTGDLSTDPRLLVAGGGGGAGGGAIPSEGGFPVPGGSGGNAGDADISGSGAGGSGTSASRFDYGAGGSPGGIGAPAAGNGTAASGGAGYDATGYQNNGTLTGGGGGGGGWFGGSGGAAGTAVAIGALGAYGGGGGGGGSSYGGLGGPVTVTTAAAGEQPSVTISWPNSTTTEVSTSVNPFIYGQPVTFTATVSPSDGGGSVAFYADGSTTPITGCHSAGLSLVSGVYQATCTTSSLGAGSHPITATYSGDMVFITSTGTLSGSQQVSQAPMTVTAPSPTITYGSPIPSLNPSYSGFVNGDTAASLSSPAICTTTATSASPGGTYPVTCSGAVDPNYTFSYVPGTLTIDQAPVFTFASPPLTATARNSYSYDFTASGYPAPTYSLANGAPSWLSINTTTGALSGTAPTHPKSFTYSVTAHQLGRFDNRRPVHGDDQARQRPPQGVAANDWQ